MIRTSEQTDELAEALAKCQGKFPAIDKSHTGKIKGEGRGGSYEYTYKYADLADTVKACAPVLSEEGISITQHPTWGPETGDILVTRVMHKGQWMESDIRMFLNKETPQAQGSAITYARRYAYCAILGIVADQDDDGALAEAAGSGPKSRKRAAPKQESPQNSATHAGGPLPPVDEMDAQQMAGELERLGLALTGNMEAKRERLREAYSTIVGPVVDEATGEVQEPDPNLASKAQLGMIGALFGEKGFPNDREVRLTYTNAVIEREVETSKELTKAEASKVIDALQAEDTPEGADKGE